MQPRVAVKQGSLTDGDELVLVNASNTQVALGSGVSGAIRRACGEGFQQHIVGALHQSFGESMPPGEVLITDAGEHPTARWVAHIAVMDYRPGAAPATSRPTLRTVREGSARLWRALEKIPGEEPLTVAMVALGAGVGGLAVDESTRESAQTLKAHWRAVPSSRIGRVTFYAYSERDHRVIEREVAREFPVTTEEEG